MKITKQLSSERHNNAHKLTEGPQTVVLPFSMSPRLSSHSPKAFGRIGQHRSQNRNHVYIPRDRTVDVMLNSTVGDDIDLGGSQINCLDSVLD
jgi:hypothetical protein